MIIEVERDKECGEFVLRFAFDRRAIAELKQLRRTHWSSDEHAWRTPTYYEEQIKDIFESLGYTVHWHEPPPAELPPLPGQQAAHAWLTSLPERLRQPVYRAIIRILHPDVGGDNAAAQALNAAWDRVRGKE